jgi:glycosyltransferase involved in cell wall biosynthesis
MKIAIIGSAMFRAPYDEDIVVHAPQKLTFDLAVELARLGHEISYFGIVTEDYKNNQNFKIEDFGYQPLYKVMKGSGKDFFTIYDQGFMMRVLERAAEFDLIYSHVAYRIGPLAGLSPKPVVATHHDSTRINEYQLMFKMFASKNFYVIPISEYMKKLLPYDNYLAVVYNGINIEQIPINQPEDYFVWVGRILPYKGLHIAISLAKQLGFHLKVAGPVRKNLDSGEPTDYGEKMLREMNRNANIEYLGAVSQIESYNLLSKAKALIFPSDGTESFCMVAAEAMVAGTPVVTTNKGPFPEIVTPGQTGFLCQNESEMKEAIKNIDKIDRSRCRELAVKRFSTKEMAKNYEKQFKRVVKNY